MTSTVLRENETAQRRTLRGMFGVRDRSRMVQLDVLRGVAILLVMFTHTTLQPKEAGTWEPVLSYVRYLGPSGVDLFFVLSGFLVGGLLFKELRATGHVDARRFLIRRGFKIWPSYFVFLGFVFLWLTFIERRGMLASGRALLPNLVHLQNYLGSPREHTWSLAVEEHFYLALPVLLLLLIGREKEANGASIRAVPFVAVGLSVLCALLRMETRGLPLSYNPFFATHLRIDSLFFGVLLGYLYHFKPHSIAFAERHSGVLLCIGIVLLVPYPALIQHSHDSLFASAVGSAVGSALLFVAYGCVLLSIIHTPVGVGWLGRRLRGPVARGVAFMGFYSYPIYLWHIDATFPVTKLLAHGALSELPAEPRWLLAFLLYVMMATAWGAIVGVLVDLPSLALRDRLFPARVQAKGTRAPEAGLGGPVFP